MHWVKLKNRTVGQMSTPSNTSGPKYPSYLVRMSEPGRVSVTLLAPIESDPHPACATQTLPTFFVASSSIFDWLGEGCTQNCDPMAEVLVV